MPLRRDIPAIEEVVRRGNAWSWSKIFLNEQGVPVTPGALVVMQVRPFRDIALAPIKTFTTADNSITVDPVTKRVTIVGWNATETTAIDITSAVGELCWGADAENLVAQQKIVFRFIDAVTIGI